MKLIVELSPLSFVTQLCTQQLLKSICGLLGVTQHLIDYLLCNAGHQIYFKRRRKKRKYNLNILVAQWTRVPNRCWVRLVCLYHIYLPRSQAFPNCALVVGGLERGLPRARPPFFPPCYFVSFLLLLQKEVTGNEAVIAPRGSSGFESRLLLDQVVITFLGLCQQYSCFGCRNLRLTLAILTAIFAAI